MMLKMRFDVSLLVALKNQTKNFVIFGYPFLFSNMGFHLCDWFCIQNSQEKSEIETKPSNCMEVGDMQMEIFGLKKNGSKRFSWGILGLNWKSSDQNECAVCLEKFKFNEKLTRMPCAHRFHSMCLLPWLKSNAHCPCCRTSVLGSNWFI